MWVISGLGAIAILVMLTAGAPAWAGVEIVKVIVRGDLIPGTSEILISTDSPTINDSGRVAFIGWSDSATAVLRTNGAGAVELVALGGDQVPGLPPGVSYGGLWGRPLLSNSGHLVFYSLLTGPGVTDANDELIVRVTPSGEIDALVREGDAAPHLGPDVTYVGVYDDREGLVWSVVVALRLNDVGDLLFRTRLTGGAVTSDDDVALERLDTAGNLTTLLREGSPIPGTPQLDAQEYFYSLANYSAAGDILTVLSVSGPGIDAGNDGVVLGTSSTGILSVIAQNGSSVPEAGPEVFVSGIRDYLVPASQNVLGQAAMLLRLEGAGVGADDDRGLFWFDGSQLSLVVREGDALPDLGNEVLARLPSTTPVPNRFGEVLLEVTVGTQLALLAFGADTGGARTVAQQNDAVPSHPNLAFRDNPWVFQYPTLNDRGDAAFQAPVDDVATGTSQGSACFRERDGELEALLADGDRIKVAPGDIRIVARCWISDTSTQSGVRALNRRGDVVMNALLIGGGMGVFVARAPPNLLPTLAPSSLLVCALVLALCGWALGRRRRFAVRR